MISVASGFLGFLTAIGSFSISSLKNLFSGISFFSKQLDKIRNIVLGDNSLGSSRSQLKIKAEPCFFFFLVKRFQERKVEEWENERRCDKAVTKGVSSIKLVTFVESCWDS